MRQNDGDIESPARRIERRRIARAATLWGGVTLGGTSLVAALAIWHLVRRGRLIREAAEPPKAIAPLEAPPAGPS